MNDDRELLKGFVCEGSQANFATLVKRYTPLVFSSAQRRIGASQAEDVTQAVFIILAKRAPQLYNRKHGNIAGWLHTTTRYASLQALRSEKRRMTHETNASENYRTLNVPTQPEPSDDIIPLIDEGLDSLSKKDRHALLMRYFRGSSHTEVGKALGISENAANKRTERALVKLERYFLRKGITVSVPLVVATIAGEGTATASTSLSTACATVALSTSTTTTLGAAAILATQTSSAILVAQIKAITISTIACSLLVGGLTATFRKSIMPPKPDFKLVNIEPFSLSYKGRTELPDGTFEFQLNDLNSHKTHFVKIGEHINGYEVKSHTLKSQSRILDGINQIILVDVSQLTLESVDHRIELVKDKYIQTKEWFAFVRTGKTGEIHHVGHGDRLTDGNDIYEVTHINPPTHTITLKSLNDQKTFTVSLEETTQHK